MASSGHFNTTGYSGRYLVFSWSVASQSVDKNQTVISWKLKGAGSSQYSWYMSGKFKVVINGSTVYSSSTRIELYNGTTVASGSYTISHSSDGTKSFSASAEAGIWTFAVNCSGSGSWSLPTIARATTPTTNKSTMYFGDTIKINLPRASSSFKHVIKAGVNGGISFTKIATNVGTSYTWTLPKSWASYMPSSDMKLRIIALTYSGSTHVGTKEVSPQITVKATSDMKPVVKISLTDDKKLLNKYGRFIRGQSKIRAKVSETLYRGTKVKSRSLTLNGVTYQSSEAVSNVITSVTQSVSAKVTDKRGMTGTKTIKPKVYDWHTPRFTSVKMRRSNSNGAVNDMGNFIRIDYSVNISSISNKNSKSMKVKYRKQGTSSWSNKNVTLSSYTQTGRIVIPAHGESSWDISLSITDDFTTYTLSDTVGTVYVLMDFHKSGKGVAFGKVSEKENTLEVSDKWKVQINGSLVDENNKNYLTENKPEMNTNLSMNNNVIWKLANPKYNDHATNKRYVDSLVKNPLKLAGTLTDFHADNPSGMYLIKGTAPSNGPEGVSITWATATVYRESSKRCFIQVLDSNAVYVFYRWNTGDSCRWFKLAENPAVSFLSGSGSSGGTYWYKYEDGRMVFEKWYKIKSSSWNSGSIAYSNVTSKWQFPYTFKNERFTITSNANGLSYVGVGKYTTSSVTQVVVYSKNPRDDFWLLLRAEGYWK